MSQPISEETWKVIYSYFKENPKWLAKHQLDSYNDFVNNKIPIIFKTNNKSQVFLFDKENSEITYQIDIYYGGKTADKYRICPPSIYDHKLQKQRPMYPNEARLKNLTYGFDLFYSIEVDVSIKRGDNFIMEKHPLPDPTGFLEDIYLGKIPIMIHSDMCILSEIPMPALPEVGESRHEPGGYFIIDGREKVLISMERRAENIIFLSDIDDTKYGKIAEVKSVSDEAFDFARTCRVQREIEGTITVRLGQSKAFIKENNYKGKSRDVPLFIMFRMLGVETDEDIIKMIVGDLDTPLGQSMANTLRDCAQDPIIREYNIYNKQMAETYLEQLTSRSKSNVSSNSTGLVELDKNKLSRLSFLYDTIREACLPHVGSDYTSKVYFLAHMTRKLILYELGLEEKTSRDTFINKRLDTSGTLLANLFMISMKQGMIYNAQRQIRRIYEFSSGEYNGPDGIINIINENNYHTIFDFKSFISLFMGNLKKGIVGGKQGVLQQLDHQNFYSMISHVRRITDPPPQGGVVQIEQRKINTTQFGFICPCESPEGGNIGMRKTLTTLATITIGYPTNQLKELCFQWGTIPLTSLNIMETHEKCRVLINGNWIGCTPSPVQLTKILRLYRRNGLINPMTSISFYPEKDELLIFCDDGRIVRPLYLYGPGNELKIQPKDIDALHNGKQLFSQLLAGRLPRSSHAPVYNTQDYLILGPEKVLGLKLDNPELLDLLDNNQAPIEYIDVQEMDTIMLAPDLDTSAAKGTGAERKYTHADFHSSMILGVLAQYSPFIHHGQLGKYLASGASKHPKQSVSVYAENYANRIDTSAHLLHHNERPLIHGRMNRAIHNDDIGTGHTIIVAVSYYDGHNQDDGLLANETSLDMGMFGSSYYKMYEEFEKMDKQSGIEERFYNPRYREEVEQYPQELGPREGETTYEHLDKFGFVKEGTYLGGDKKEVLIGKYIQTKDAFGQIEFSDASKTVKKDNKGSYVDKVFVASSNADGMRLAKVRTCQYRKPAIGDKFASRNGQKGTIGLMIPREDMPFTEDGLVPDFIIHPSSYPKRLTLNQLIEILYGHAAVDCGFYGLAGAFEHFDTEDLGDVLADKLGLTDYGNTVLYNGRYGEQMHARIFMGPIYFQRLKYMVNDKINYRPAGHRQDGIPVPGGAYTVRERQVVSGRAHGGGIKIGEMERDALMSHGIFSFINERDMTRGDKFSVFVSIKTGEIAIANPDAGLYYDSLQDGPISYQLVEGTGQGSKEYIGLNTLKKSHNAFVKVNIPYVTKLVIQEMAGMGLSVRLRPRVLRVVQQLAKNGDTESLDALMLHTQDLIDNEEKEIGELLEASIVSHKPVPVVTPGEIINFNTIEKKANMGNETEDSQPDNGEELQESTEFGSNIEPNRMEPFKAPGELPMPVSSPQPIGGPSNISGSPLQQVPNAAVMPIVDPVQAVPVQMGGDKESTGSPNMEADDITPEMSNMDSELFGIEPLKGGDRQQPMGIQELPTPSINLVGGALNDTMVQQHTPPNESNMELGLDQIEESMTGELAGLQEIPSSFQNGGKTPSSSPDVKSVSISGSAKDLSFMGVNV